MSAMRRLWFLAGIMMPMAACINGQPPLAPTAVAEPAPPLTAPPLPTTVPGVLALSMPVEPGDAANTVFGIAPFGYHGAEHAADGHPGWDIEYRIGGIVRAAAAGTVENVVPDSVTAGRFTVQIQHTVGTHHYRTSYSNLASVNAGIAAQEVVRAGQPIGTPGTLGTLGTLGDPFSARRLRVLPRDQPSERGESGALPDRCSEAILRWSVVERGIPAGAGRAVRDKPARPSVPCLANVDARRRRRTRGHSIYEAHGDRQ